MFPRMPHSKRGRGSNPCSKCRSSQRHVTRVHQVTTLHTAHPKPFQPSRELGSQQACKATTLQRVYLSRHLFPSKLSGQKPRRFHRQVTTQWSSLARRSQLHHPRDMRQFAQQRMLQTLQGLDNPPVHSAEPYLDCPRPAQACTGAFRLLHRSMFSFREGQVSAPHPRRTVHLLARIALQVWMCAKRGRLAQWTAPLCQALLPETLECAIPQRPHAALELMSLYQVTGEFQAHWPSNSPYSLACNWCQRIYWSHPLGVDHQFSLEENCSILELVPLVSLFGRLLNVLAACFPELPRCLLVPRNYLCLWPLGLRL